MQRATRRLKIAEVAATHFVGLHCPERGFHFPTWDAIRGTLASLMAHGGMPLGSLPCNNTLATLAHKWIAGQRDASAYVDAEGRGRVAIPLHPELRAEIARLLDAGQQTTRTAIVAAIEAMALREGIPVPASYRIHQEIRRHGLVRRISTRQGSKAAFLDGMPHFTYVTSEPHKVAMLDEMQWTTYAQATDAKGRTVSIEPTLILMDDACSSAILSWHLANPVRRLRDDGTVHTAGFDGDDVLATLLSAAIPELAPGSCAELAGYTPETLRFDNAQQHKGLLEVLAHVPSMKVPRLPMHSPEDRALIEARVHRMKQLAEGLDYLRDTVIPIDRLPEHLRNREIGSEIVDVENDERDPADVGPNTTTLLGRARTKLAANGQRTTRRTVVKVEDLPTLDELRRHIDRRVAAYNRTLAHSRLGMPPAAAHRGARDDFRKRNGTDLLATLPVKTVVVDTKGIAVARNGKETRYAFEVDGWMAMVGTEIAVREDPLGRCLFAEVHGKTRVLVPLPDYGKDADLRRLKESLELGPRVYSKLGRELQKATYGEPPPATSAPEPTPAPPSAPRKPTRKVDLTADLSVDLAKSRDAAKASVLAGTQRVPTSTPPPAPPLRARVQRAPDAPATHAKSVLQQAVERMRAHRPQEAAFPDVMPGMEPWPEPQGDASTVSPGDPAAETTPNAAQDASPTETGLS